MARGPAAPAASTRTRSGPTSRSSQQEINGHPLVYLDSASSSQKPSVVIDAVADYYREYNANVHRGIYTIGEKATAAYEEARARVARFINAPDSHEVIFTRNATEAINLVAYSWGRRNIGRGDAIVLTEMEHHANLVPWQLLVQEQDGDLEFIPITDDGILRLDVFEVLLRLKPKLVAFTHVATRSGRSTRSARWSRWPTRPARSSSSMAPRPCRTCRSTSRRSAATSTRSAATRCSAPMGSGALWARRELLEAMPPFLSGGEMIREVHLRRSDFNEIPWKFEAGTPAVGDAIGLGVAAEYLTALGMDAVREHERDLVAYALDVARRASVPGIELYGPDRRPARRRRPVQPARHPPARRRPGAGPRRRGGASRPPLHDAAPRAPRPRRHGPGQLQRLLDPRGHRRPRRRPARGPARLQRLTVSRRDRGRASRRTRPAHPSPRGPRSRPRCPRPSGSG